MIVHHHNRGSAGHDGQTEDFPRMAKNRVHGSHGYEVVPLDFTAGVKH